MTEQKALVAKGHVLDVKENLIVFNPLGSNYELHLTSVTAVPATVKSHRVEAILRGKGRKIWTVRSGGNFVEPIMGSPRILQGRIRQLNQRHLVVQASALWTIELPVEDSAYDLVNGDLRVGALVNISLLPGSSIELSLPGAGM